MTKTRARGKQERIRFVRRTIVKPVFVPSETSRGWQEKMKRISAAATALTTYARQRGRRKQRNYLFPEPIEVWGVDLIHDLCELIALRQQGTRKRESS